MTKFTPAQKQAIECDDFNILVSAAAGSGKTAVLTERIVRHVSQGTVNIDQLLVVTFTEAASAEMRMRIGKRLQELGNFTQLARLPFSNISTIHAFCSKLVRENFQAVDVDPAYRIADEAELSIIKRQVMDGLFEKEYEENTGFLDLVDVYGGKTMDGRLDVLVRKIYDFMESDPFPEVAARRYANYFSEDIPDIGQTPWAQIVLEELILGLDGAIDGCAQALVICNKPGGPAKYYDKILDEKNRLSDLRSIVLDGCFEEIYQGFKNIDWGRLPSISKNDDVDADLKERVTDLRNKAVKKRVDDLTKGVFFASPDKMVSDLKALKPRVHALMDLSIKFATAFAEEKRERNVLDFSDLEHFAIKILYPSGPADMTPNCDYKFYEVLIDEYQDSNQVQDLILTAVADRRFMVGDVKQSIYRFRRANPKLFLEKYDSYRNLKNGTRIDLSNNFRSRPEVLDAANFFFEQLMCAAVGDVAYDHAATLYPGREEYPPLPHGRQMQVEILDQSEDDDYEPETEEETPDNITAEARLAAKSIRELLDTPRMVWDKGLGEARPCKPSDIVILTRSLSSVAAITIEELKNHGIDAVADLNAGFLDQLEIKTVMSFLRVIDNPRQDIELVAVLRSPVYALTDDELLQVKLTPISIERPQFYDYVLACKGNEKVQKFLQDLEKWRALAIYTPISRLINTLYTDTEYPAHVLNMPGGDVRQGNLRLLLEWATEFEKTSFKGLFHFVNYIERLYETDTIGSGAAPEPEQGGEGQVRLMTIHKSKGLEFPIVICTFLGRLFNRDDMRQPVILHPEFGVGPYYVDTKRRTRANTLARFGLGKLLAREALSEELRCLYVALTRAEELIVLTARSKNLARAIEKWSNYIGGNDTLLPTYYRSGAKSYLDWIMPCLLRHSAAKELIRGMDATPQDHRAEFTIRIHKPLLAGDSEVRKLPPKTEKLLTPYRKETSPIPSKLSISEIRKLYNITPDSTLLDDPPPSFDPPEFLRGESKPSPAEIGKAMHTVAEFLDYDIHRTKDDINGLVKSLADKNLLSQEEVGFIDQDKILKLANSPLAERIRVGKNVKKETPFVYALPAKELYPDAEGETILVHGIVDCYFEENGEIVIVDYKSDTKPEKHLTQMKIYKKAIAEATAMNVKELLVYSFALDQSIALTDSNN